MRFMVIVKATKDSEAGKMPSRGNARRDGASSTKRWSRPASCSTAPACSRARRARASASTAASARVVDGPFAETKELIAGYWIIQVKNKAEAIEWMKRCPNPYNEDGEIEIRQFFELEDFGESPAVDHHKAVGEQLAAQKK